MKFRGARLVRREPEARSRSERATELAQASVGEEQRAAGLDVRTLWEVDLAAERTRALVAQAREEAAQRLAATVREARAAFSRARALPRRQRENE